MKFELLKRFPVKPIDFSQSDNKTKTILLIAVMMSASLCASSQTTYEYAVRDGKSLKLDYYRSSHNIEGLSQHPCVVFAFGGGFAAGARNEGLYKPYFQWLQDEGFDVVSIDYRLASSHAYDAYGWKRGLRGMLQRFRAAVNWAAEDMLTATAFVVSHAEEWGIDASRIVACGSSAGAITSLQAENMIVNHSDAAKVLPQGFNYAGVISFAGAIFSMKGKPRWPSHPCPLMMFHGNSDNNVPFRKAAVFGIGFYGSETIARQMKKMDASYYFYRAEYRDHKMANEPMNQNRREILEFLTEAVVKRNPMQKEKTVRNLSLSKTRTHFGLKAYLSHNYAD